MSKNDEQLANLAMQEFSSKIRAAERIQVAASLIESLELVPQELRTEAHRMFERMVESFNN